MPASEAASPTAVEECMGTESKKDIFEEIKKMNATLQVVAKDVTTIKETTKELKDSVEDIKVRLGEAEQRISEMEDASVLTEAKVDKVQKRLEALWSRVEDFENRSRRNNVRIIGLKEGVEAPGNVDKYVTEILAKALELSGSEFEIKRAHCSPVPMPEPNEPPRAIFVRFLRSSAREKVLRVAREKRGVDWQGVKLSFFEDVTRELAEKRKAFNSAKKRLRELQVKHRLVYPATLIFTWNGQKKVFKDGKEAEKFLQEST
nr:LINE-1 type transposase domain-containing protein 1 [Nothobranchius furzeri]